MNKWLFIYFEYWTIPVDAEIDEEVVNANTASGFDDAEVDVNMQQEFTVFQSYRFLYILPLQIIWLPVPSVNLCLNCLIKEIYLFKIQNYSSNLVNFFSYQKYILNITWARDICVYVWTLSCDATCVFCWNISTDL